MTDKERAVLQKDIKIYLRGNVNWKQGDYSVRGNDIEILNYQSFYENEWKSIGVQVKTIKEYIDFIKEHNPSQYIRQYSGQWCIENCESCDGYFIHGVNSDYTEYEEFRL